jgi:hypothetical protein
MVTSARYTSADHSLVTAVIDGAEWQGLATAVVDGRLTVVGEGNLQRTLQAWLDAGNAPAAFDPPPVDLDAAKQRRIEAAWAAMGERLATGTVQVTTSAGTHIYGIDQTAQDNTTKALLGVLAGLSPDPRPWTPKGLAVPILLSHADVKLVAGVVGLAYERHVQAYLAHKRAIAALTTAATVAAYDLAQGWPTDTSNAGTTP